MRAKDLDSARKVAEYVQDLVRPITKANGYKTDIGTRIFRGRRKIDDNHLPCAVIIEGDDRVMHLSEKSPSAKVEQQYVLGGYSVCDADNPNDTALDIISDLKRALFAPQAADASRDKVAIVYKGRDIGPRADGGANVFALIYIAITYNEDLSNPEGA